MTTRPQQAQPQRTVPSRPLDLSPRSQTGRSLTLPIGNGSLFCGCSPVGTEAGPIVCSPLAGRVVIGLPSGAQVRIRERIDDVATIFIRGPEGIEERLLIEVAPGICRPGPLRARNARDNGEGGGSDD